MITLKKGCAGLVGGRGRWEGHVLTIVPLFMLRRALPLFAGWRGRTLDSVACAPYCSSGFISAFYRWVLRQGRSAWIAGYSAWALCRPSSARLLRNGWTFGLNCVRCEKKTADAVSGFLLAHRTFHTFLLTVTCATKRDCSALPLLVADRARGDALHLSFCRPWRAYLRTDRKGRYGLATDNVAGMTGACGTFY